MAEPLVSAIRASGLTINDSLQQRLNLFLSDEDLERILNKALRGLVLDQPLRTRSKVLKSNVCEALGYPIPASFKKTTGHEGARRDWSDHRSIRYYRDFDPEVSS